MSNPDPATSDSAITDPAGPTLAEPAPAEDPAGPAGPGAPATAVPVPPGTTRHVSGVQLSIAVVALLAGAALFLSGYSLGRQAATTPGTPGSEQAAFVPFWDAYRAITEQYAGGTVDRKAVIEGAIGGMIQALGDPFSSYLSSEDYKKSLQGIAGQFEGIGAEIGGRKADGSGAQCSPLGPDCQMVVISPIPGSPAETAGVQAGDVITEIDSASVNGSTVDEAVAKIRGPKDTTVVLTIVRKGGAPITISIVRAVIAEKEIVSRSLAGGQVGYIRITGFSDNAANDFTRVLADDVKAGQRRIVVDLRGNPGGFVTAARKIASQFLASGPVYWQEDSKGNQVASMVEPNGVATDPGIRVVVLIDKGSASASEIVAGALQDTGRATLVGQTSYGKGTIQEWQPLPNDTGGFRLTIAKWLTPDKRWIHHTGLTPDVAVDVPQSTPPDQDPVLDKALEVLGASSAAVLQVAA
jgi:carboxyl-terminal processing protease